MAAVEIFVSYSHKDERYRIALGTHLGSLKRQRRIKQWHDRKILPGEQWARAINHALDRCEIVLLLISADFLNSDYCMGVELKRALERHRSGTARVVPIIVRPCDWLHSQFAALQALPRDGRPITKWGNQDEAWTDVARGIRLVLAAEGPQTTEHASDKHSAETERPRVAPPGQPRGLSAMTGTSPFGSFLDTFAKEAGRKLARDGLPALWNAALSDAAAEHRPGLLELVEGVLLSADHDYLGELVRECYPGQAAPRSKAARARLVAGSYGWDEGLVDAAFRARTLRRLCAKHDLPVGSKEFMARTLVAAVRDAAA